MVAEANPSEEKREIDVLFLQQLGTFLLHVFDAENTTEEQKKVAKELDDEIIKLLNSK